jgi:hypothetical protein
LAFSLADYLLNVNYGTARKWKKAYEDDPKKRVPIKKTNLTNIPVSQLNEVHKALLMNFFDEESTAARTLWVNAFLRS